MTPAFGVRMLVVLLFSVLSAVSINIHHYQLFIYSPLYVLSSPTYTPLLIHVQLSTIYYFYFNCFDRY